MKRRLWFKSWGKRIDFNFEQIQRRSEGHGVKSELHDNRISKLHCQVCCVSESIAITDDYFGGLLNVSSLEIIQCHRYGHREQRISSYRLLRMAAYISILLSTRLLLLCLHHLQRIMPPGPVVAWHIEYLIYHDHDPAAPLVSPSPRSETRPKGRCKPFQTVPPPLPPL